jgi:hypothetical protein
MADDCLTLLLPVPERFAGQPLPDLLATRLGRADRLPAGEAGERAQLERHFSLVPRRWPVAALTRSLDAQDAHLGAWVRADPAWLRPDLGTARLMASGETMQLTVEEAQSLLAPLRTLFGDVGYPISAPHPGRWYLQLPREAKIPEFSTPEQGLGDDALAHLPDGSPEARRWRALLNEAQILLHQHPLNGGRRERGLPPVNSLWFWGGGVLPDFVRTGLGFAEGGDILLRSLAARAGIGAGPTETGSGLRDLREVREVGLLVRQVDDAFRAFGAGRYSVLRLDAADGSGFELRPGQRWRFWRRPARSLSA